MFDPIKTTFKCSAWHNKLLIYFAYGASCPVNVDTPTRTLSCLGLICRQRHIFNFYVKIRHWTYLVAVVVKAKTICCLSKTKTISKIRPSDRRQCLTSDSTQFMSFRRHYLSMQSVALVAAIEYWQINSSQSKIRKKNIQRHTKITLTEANLPELRKATQKTRKKTKHKPPVICKHCSHTGCANKRQSLMKNSISPQL